MKGAQACNTLTLFNSGATLSQDSSSSLNVTTLALYSGTAILRGHNTVGGTLINGANVKIASADALGAGFVGLELGGLVALSNMHFTNSLDIDFGVGISAAHSATMTMTGGTYSLDMHLGQITFGTGNNDGTIVWADSLSTDNSTHDYTIDIHAGTLKGTTINNGLAQLMPASGFVTVEGGATLDLGGATGVSLANLSGSGTITNTGNFATLDITGGTFLGLITGSIALNLPNVTGIVTLVADNTYTGGTTIDDNCDLVIGQGGTTGSVLGDIVTGGPDSNVTFNRSSTVTIDNLISGAAEITYLHGKFLVAHDNALVGGTQIELGATLTIDRASAIGKDELVLSEGTFAVTRSMTLNEVYDFFGGATESVVEVAHGKTLTLEGSRGASIFNHAVFGAGGKDGTIVWDVTGNALSDASTLLEIAAGTLRMGPNGGIGFNNATQSMTTQIDSGATFDVAGNSMIFHGLEGSGTLTSSFNGLAVVQASGVFDGTITGKIELAPVNFLTLAGACTYTLGTIIVSGATLTLGGTKGSVKGEIDNDGSLVFQRSNTFDFGASIFGAGTLAQEGSGTVNITHANSYTGGTFIFSGTLESSHAGALGSGLVSVRQGTLLSSITQTLTNPRRFDFDGVVAAAHGKTLTLDPSGGYSVFLAAPGHIRFGSTGNDGVVVLNTDPGSSISSSFDLAIDAGTLRAGTGNFSLLFSSADSCTVTAGATLDTAGQHQLSIVELAGNGAIVNSRAHATDITILNGAFAGTIGAGLNVFVFDEVTLSGGGAFAQATIVGNSTLHLINTAHENVAFAKNGTLILDTPAQFTGTVSGFVKTDLIDLTTIKFKHAHLTFDAGTDILTVTQGTHSASLHFADGYTQSDFDLANDGHNHVAVITDLVTAPLAIAEPFLELG